MPLRPIETREQRQQRLLQSKQARQAREQEIKQGLSSLPGQAAWMGGLMAPSSGITDYLGLYPEPPTGEGITGETMPSFGENIREKRYLDAFYQGLGLTGDLAMGAGTVYPPALALGAGMKVISGMGKTARTAKQGDMAARILPRYFVNEAGGVPNADVLQINLPKSYNPLWKIRAKYVERKDGKFMVSHGISSPTSGTPAGPLTERSFVYDSLDQAKTGLINYALESPILKAGTAGSKTEAKLIPRIRKKLESERHASVLPDETGVIDENFDFIPFTEKPLLDTELSLKGDLPKMTREDIDEMWKMQRNQDPRNLELMAEAAARKRGVPVSEIHAERKAANVPFEIPTSRKPDAFAKADQLGAKADELLEWQKPLTEQQPGVQEKIKNLIGEDSFNKAAADGLTGEDVYGNFEEVMLNDDLAQYGLEFLKPKLSTEKLGAGAYLNEAGIRGIVYGPESVEVFDPVKYRKVEPGAKLPGSLQPGKIPIGLTNKKITARQLISGRIDPDFYGKEELMGAVGSIRIKKKPHKYSTSTREVEKLAPWVYQKKGTEGIKDFDGIEELFSEADPIWAAQLADAKSTQGKEELINKWLRNDDLIPSQVDDVDAYNWRVENQDEISETLKSKGYTPEGMTDDEVSSVFEKKTADPESVEVEVFVDVDDDGLPPFNRGGPVTRPLYSDKRYLI